MGKKRAHIRLHELVVKLAQSRVFLESEFLSLGAGIRESFSRYKVFLNSAAPVIAAGYRVLRNVLKKDAALAYT